MKNLNLIVKADVQGSVEAVKASLEKLSNDEVRVRVIHGGVGAINESDVMLASTSQAIIVGFNVRPDAAARDTAARANVDMRMYRVIYDAINEIEAAMKGMLAPKFREVLLGHAEVRQTYKVSGVGTVAGCYVQDGKLQRKDCQVRLVRDGIVIHEGVLASLQRFKDQAKEVAGGLRVRPDHREVQRHQGRRYCGSLHHGGNSPVNGGAPSLYAPVSGRLPRAARLRPQVVRTRVLRQAKPCFGGIHFRQRMVNRGPHETGFMGQAILWKPSPWRKFPSKRGSGPWREVFGKHRPFCGQFADDRGKP